MAIAADGSGNIYFTTPSNTSLYEMPGAAISAGVVTPLLISTTVGPSPSHIVIDGTSAVWTTSGSNFITRTASSTPNTGLNFASQNFTSFTPTYGLSVTAVLTATRNYVYVGSQGTSNALLAYQGLGNTYSTSGNLACSRTHHSYCCRIGWCAECLVPEQYIGLKFSGRIFPRGR